MGGNTVPPLMSKSRNWCFTLNNPVNNFYNGEYERLRFITYQLELGESGTEHIQGYCIFRDNTRLAQCKQFIPGAHWEIRRGSHTEAKEYCEKGDTKLSPRYQWGIEPKQGKRNDLDRAKELLDAGEPMERIAEECFCAFIRYHRGFQEYRNIRFKHENKEPRVTVIYGPTGTGKTKYCNEKYPEAYWQFGTKWFDGYQQEKEVIFDEFYGNIPYSMVLRLCDRYPFRVESKGGSLQWNAENIIFTSNKRPDRWYDKDRMSFDALKRRIHEWIYMPVLDEIHIFNNFNDFDNKITYI